MHRFDLFFSGVKPQTSVPIRDHLPNLPLTVSFPPILGPAIQAINGIDFVTSCILSRTLNAFSVAEILQCVRHTKTRLSKLSCNT